MSDTDWIGTRRKYKTIAALAGALAIAAGPAMAAGASTSGSGNTSASILGGSLSVASISTMTALTPTIGASASGALPTAQWADGTGLGLGWNGTVAISPLTYTGAWSPANSSPALGASTSSFTGTDDGRYYTVTVTSSTLTTSTTFSWTSDATGDSAGGTGVVATNGTPIAVGTKGVMINFSATSNYPVNSSYTILVGTQSASSMVVDTGTAPAITSSGTTSTPPVYANNGSTIAAGSTVGTVNASGAVKVISAAIGTGASGTGYYTAGPGVTLTADSNSWAKTYSGNLTYSIVTGP